MFDAGEADGELFIVMELVDGPSLAEAIADRGPLPEDDAVRIATQVLSALGAAHASGIVHRDVKPANILLDARGDAKLADFGIAKRFDDLTDSLTATGLVVGTPRYLSPEQARGEPISPATDIYAVGVILHEMLAGAPPFADESLLATANRDRHADPSRRRRPTWTSPRSVADAVARALAPDPADRFDSADAMINALLAANGADAARGGESRCDAPRRPAPARPEGCGDDDHAAGRDPGDAARRRARRDGSRALVIFGALCLVGLAGIAIAARTTSRRQASSSRPPMTPRSGRARPRVTTPATTPVTESTAVVTVAPTVATDRTARAHCATVDELVPGFPVPADIEVFLVQLQNDPTVIGATRSRRRSTSSSGCSTRSQDASRPTEPTS